MPANKHHESSIKSIAGTKGMWKHVVLLREPRFWPPLEVLPSLTWSWTSVTPRLLDGPDKVNLELIPLLFPFKMHVKLTEPHKSCPCQSHDKNICNVVASRSTSILHFSLTRKTFFISKNVVFDTLYIYTTCNFVLVVFVSSYLLF